MVYRTDNDLPHISRPTVNPAPTFASVRTQCAVAREGAVLSWSALWVLIAELDPHHRMHIAPEASPLSLTPKLDAIFLHRPGNSRMIVANVIDSEWKFEADEVS